MNVAERQVWCVGRGVDVLARILVSQIFLISGTMKVLDPAGTQGHMASRPLLAQFEQWLPHLMWLAVAVELIGGLCLLLGWGRRLAAVALIVFLLPVTFIFHDFWTYPEGERPTQMFSFLHNWALIGALLLLAGMRRVRGGELTVEG